MLLEACGEGALTLPVATSISSSSSTVAFDLITRPARLVGYSRKCQSINGNKRLAKTSEPLVGSCLYWIFALH